MGSFFPYFPSNQLARHTGTWYLDVNVAFILFLARGRRVLLAPAVI